jgi:CubicO group peptidase (beta-lactamase class C family)
LRRAWLVGLLALAAARVTGAACEPPAAIDDGWETAAPDASGFDGDAFCAALGRAASVDANVHAVVIARHGRLVGEVYRHGPDRSVWSLFARETRFDPTVPHDLRSITKSVVGLLFGIARRDHAIDLGASALSFYPDYANLRSPARDAITLEHLLTMSSGLEWHETVGSYGSFGNDETRLYWDWSPYRFVLGRAIVAAPGTRFNYNGGGVAVLADVIRRTEGTPLRTFAQTALFEPLGIRDWKWIGDLYGKPLAFAGLRMRPRDVLRIGAMVLAQGRWQGRDVVPSEWIAASLRPHLGTDDGLSYGYLWWTGTVDWRGKELAWSAAFGNGGQRLYVVPDLDLAVVITAGAYNDVNIRSVDADLFSQIVEAVRR